MYNKLFTSILDSSIWLEPTPTRIVWVTLLAAMDEDGFVRMATVENLAKRAIVTIEEAEAAAKTLESPDRNCPEQERQGRRIERVDGGWMVLNSKKYRDIVNREKEKEQTRLRVARHRAKAPGNAHVTVANEKVTVSEATSASEADHYHRDSRTVLHLLNETSGRSFRETDPNLTFISSRLREPGVDLSGVRKMIERQCKRWKGTEQAEYLRPETLFNKTKFDGYYAARNEPIHEHEIHQRVNPRLEGVSRNPINDYAAGAKRKIERQDAERLAQQVAETSEQPPSKAP